MVAFVKKMVIWRMVSWLFVANLLYLFALLISWPPQVQTGLLAGANCALGAWVGYWVNEALFFNSNKKETTNELIISAKLLCKALIVCFTMLACNVKLG